MLYEIVIKNVKFHSKNSVFLSDFSFSWNTVAHSEPNQTPKIKRFAKVVNGVTINYFRETPHLICLTGF